MANEKEKKIKNPGARGGKYYINDKGDVIYGTKPTGKSGKVADDKGQEHSRLGYDSKKDFKEQFPSFEEFNARAKANGLSELDAKQYKQIYQREHKEYIKGVKDSGTKENRGNLDDSVRSYISNRITYTENGFEAVPYEDLKDKVKEYFNHDLSKEDYMKIYKKQYYQYTKMMKNKEKTKELTEPEKVQELKKTMFDEKGDMNVKAMLELPKIPNDEDGDGHSSRDDIFLQAWKEHKNIKNFFTADEYESIKDAMGVYFSNTDKDFWVEQKDFFDSGMKIMGALDFAYSDYAGRNDKWDEYEKFSNLFDRVQEYHEYFESGMDKVDGKKKEALQKKAQRDKELKTLNKKDKERISKIETLQNDEKEFSYNLFGKLKGMGIKTDKEIQDDPDTKAWIDMGIQPDLGINKFKKEHWDEISNVLGFEVMDGEKKYIYDQVLNPILVIGNITDKYGSHLDEKSYKDFFNTNMMDSDVEAVNKALIPFYGRRMNADGKTFDTPMEKMLSETKREFDDKLDSLVDMSIVANTIQIFEYDPTGYKNVRKYFDENSSVSETIHSIHKRKKELDVIVDKGRIWGESMKSSNVSEHLTPKEKEEHKNAVLELYDINKLHAELVHRLITNEAVKKEFVTNKNVPISTGAEIQGKVSLMNKISPDTQAGERIGNALTFIEAETNKSSAFYQTVLKVKPTDLRTENIPEEDKYRAFAKGNGLYTNHKTCSTGTYVHEFGHILENNNKSISEKARDFLMTRMNGTKSYMLDHLFPNVGFKDVEVAHIDSFLDPYIGRDYEKEYTWLDKSKEAHSSHEAFSMGIQYMYENPINFMVKDPEHYLFTRDALKNH